MPIPTLFGHHFQVAYVVRNTRAARAAFATRFNLKNWHVMDMVAMHGPGSSTHSISLAWSGRMMIEMIEPNPAVPSFYTDFLPDADDGLRLHHLGFLIPTAEEFAATVSHLTHAGFPTAMAGNAGGLLDFHYADTRTALGHYYELIHLPPAGADFFAAVPRN